MAPPVHAQHLKNWVQARSPFFSEGYCPQVLPALLGSGDLTALFLLNVFGMTNVTPLMDELLGHDWGGLAARRRRAGQCQRCALAEYDPGRDLRGDEQRGLQLRHAQAMVRYGYSMGREGILPRVLGKTHPRWKSPYVASFAQSGFTLLVLLLLGLVIQHTNADGSVSYALGVASGPTWQQTSGIVSFGWLASIVTMCIILVYILTNVAAPFFAHSRGELRTFPHIVAPAASTLLLLLPLASYILPPLPGIGPFLTGLGFAPTPFPANILPVFVLAWVAVGLFYATALARRDPERYQRLGQIVGEEEQR